MEFSEKISPEMNSDEWSVISQRPDDSWLLAAHEKAVTFNWPGQDGAVQPVLNSISGHIDGSFMPCLKAL